MMREDYLIYDKTTKGVPMTHRFYDVNGHTLGRTIANSKLRNPAEDVQIVRDPRLIDVSEMVHG
jgi:hypothetical protein